MEAIAKDVRPDETHGALMDAQYRWQRHVYDLTRKYYLLGRDGLIRALAAPEGALVLEVGCGTGRNLALAARRYPAARLFGLDISAEMLKNARSTAPMATLAQGDATGFDVDALFGQTGFDRIFMSYTVSMIPDWRAAIDQAARLVAPHGRLHIVDFGQQERLPSWFRSMLRAWLGKFHVTPRAELFDVCRAVAERYGLECTATPILRGYAWRVEMRR